VSFRGPDLRFGLLLKNVKRQETLLLQGTYRVSYDILSGDKDVAGYYIHKLLFLSGQCVSLRYLRWLQAAHRQIRFAIEIRPLSMRWKRRLHSEIGELFEATHLVRNCFNREPRQMMCIMSAKAW